MSLMMQLILSCKATSSVHSVIFTPLISGTSPVSCFYLLSAFYFNLVISLSVGVSPSLLTELSPPRFRNRGNPCLLLRTFISFAWTLKSSCPSRETRAMEDISLTYFVYSPVTSGWLRYIEKTETNGGHIEFPEKRVSS